MTLRSIWNRRSTERYREDDPRYEGWSIFTAPRMVLPRMSAALQLDTAVAGEPRMFRNDLAYRRHLVLTLQQRMVTHWLTREWLNKACLAIGQTLLRLVYSAQGRQLESDEQLSERLHGILKTWLRNEAGLKGL
jgi:hypothetical protein